MQRLNVVLQQWVITVLTHHTQIESLYLRTHQPEAKYCRPHLAQPCPFPLHLVTIDLMVATPMISPPMAISSTAALTLSLTKVPTCSEVVLSAAVKHHHDTRSRPQPPNSRMRAPWLMAPLSVVATVNKSLREKNEKGARKPALSRY